MAKILYPNNHKPIRVSERDRAKIGRGYDLGHKFGLVKDLDTKELFTVEQASCGARNCNCAVDVHLYATPKVGVNA